MRRGQSHEEKSQIHPINTSAYLYRGSHGSGHPGRALGPSRSSPGPEETHNKEPLLLTKGALPEKAGNKSAVAD